jgi:Cd2+/Zn2+-exporting ATPase
MKYNYTLQNLNCAHCAGKIEEKIAQTEGFENVSFVFATKKLNFESEKPNPLTEIQQICDSIEDGVTVVENKEIKKQAQEEPENSRLSIILLIVAIVCGLGALAVELFADDTSWGFWTQMGLSLIALALAGFKTFERGFKNIFKLRFEETALMTIAVIAAFCLGEFVEAAMVTILFSIGELIEDKAVNASRRDIEKLAQIRPDFATVISNGKEVVVPAEDVVVGSTIVVKPYERVPLDGIIQSGETTLDTSALTGESLPLDAKEGSEVLSGAINGSGLIQIVTTKAFGDSTATRILRLVEDASAQKGKNEKLISRFASIYTPIVLAIALIIAVLPPILGLGAFTQWLYRALVCLVASCPCAIVISVPLAYYSGIGAASELGVLIKGGKYLEALAKADTFVFDKTGTLTTGKLSVNKITATASYSEDEVLALAASCEKYSVHPIAQAIKDRAKSLKLPELSDYSENAGHGTSGIYNGKRLECGGTKILSEQQKKSITESGSVFVVYDGEIIGIISVSDTTRDEAKSVIAQLKALGVKNTVMLTGDSAKTAEKVSAELGLSEFKADLLPADKLSIFTEKKKSAKAACFVGDGINDAPVLSASDCGIAMGLGSEAAIEAADAVLASGTLAQLPKAIKLSRRVMNTVKTNIIFALTIKAAVIILAALGLAAMWMSVIADTGVSVACVLYAARLLKKGN